MTARKTRSTRTQKKTDTGSGLPSPPSSSGDGKPGDRNAAGPSSAMISPPPEENGDHRSKSSAFVEVSPLKPASKRKRLASTSSLLNLTGDPTTTTGDPVTPNPKARKQSRRSKSPLLSDEDSDSPIHDSPTKKATTKSPHASNPRADYLPPVPSYARHVLTTRNRRSTTPIPPYEPPADRFTPPREIIVQPSSTQKKKPRQTKKKQPKLQIKEEPPEIDLTAPIPPPSPTDDPLLLRGPPRSSRSISLPKQSRGTSPIRSPEHREKTPSPPHEPQTLPTSSPWTEVNMDNVDAPPIPFTSDSMTPESPEVHPEEPTWQEGPSGWTDSSDNEEPTFDQEGEYTGKFTSYVVPTKPDPPTTVQRERQEAWGRPISPFPYPTDRKSRWSSPLTPAETQEEPRGETQEPGKGPETQPALDVADLTTTPRDTEEELFGPDQNTAPEEATASPNANANRQVLIPATIQPMFDFDGLSSPDHSYETPIRPPKGEPVPFIRVFPKRPSTSSSSKIQFPPPQHPSIFFSPARNVVDLERDEERFVDRALSQAPEDDDEDNKTVELSQQSLHLQQLDVPEEDTEEEDDEGVVDLGVIKISSEDPMAAAKAAAILKLHDYDLVKRAHRRNIIASGISRMSPRRRPKGDSRDGSFVRPISPAVMPELIREAETELEKSFSGSERFTTPMRTNLSAVSTSRSRYIDPSRLFDPTGPREWAKNDWKILDACFTDERLDVAEKMGMVEGSLADVTDIRLDDVVSRFVEVIGGDAALAGLGPSWMRRDILKRVRALEKKQRAGKGAPGTPRRSQTPFSESGHMEVPDFTPIGPRRVADRLDEGNPKLPPTLLAPRYSHLMDEAVSIGRGTGGEPSGSSSGVTVKAPPDSPSLFRRLTSPLFSYLPLMSKGTSGESSKDADKSGLPLPPPELFEKERGTIVTPAAKLPPKPPHPKDQVELHAVPSKPSMIPKPKMQPKRLVDLRPAPSKPSPEPVTRSLTNDRRQSGGSVKDLVKSFETLDESVSSLRSSTRSVQSVNEWRAESLGAGSKGEGSSKPQWKP